MPSCSPTRPSWRRSTPTWTPERGEPFERPSLVITGRQDDSVGHVDRFALLPHYPRATFATLDLAGHNLQIEQPELFGALMKDWLGRVRG